MNELERAATALRDRPLASPAPIAQIERRAGVLRRRRRAFEAGAVVLVVLLLGSAAVALGSMRGGDDQGVFVGEGPTSPASVPTVTTATYRLSAPVDEATAVDLQFTLHSRLFAVGTGGEVSLTPEHDAVVVTGAKPGAPIYELVTSPGGFELRPFIGPLPYQACEAPDHGAVGAYFTSAVLLGAPTCYGLAGALPLPSPTTTAAGMSLLPSGGYQVEVVLTSDAVATVRDSGQPCTSTSGGECVSGLSVVSGGSILAFDSVWLATAEPSGMQLRLSGFADPDDAQMWAALLANPLPAGVAFRP